MKNKDIYRLYEGLCEIADNSSLRFNIKTSLILAKDKAILEPIYDAIYQSRQSIIKKYGKLINNGSDWNIPYEKVEEFSSELNELMEIDNNICLEGITLQDLGDNIIPIALIQKILPLIEE